VAKVAAATAYSAIAKATTTVKPKCMASSVARIALITEAQPLTPHAHGTQSGARSETCLRPSGNGIPMQNASGAIRTMEIATLAGWGKERSRSNRTGRTRR